MTDPQLALVGNAVVLATVIVSHIRSKRSIQDIHIAMNSRLDQLIVAARAEGHALGVKEEQDSHREAT
jgi:hypothetical protein